MNYIASERFELPTFDYSCVEKILRPAIANLNGDAQPTLYQLASQVTLIAIVDASKAVNQGEASYDFEGLQPDISTALYTLVGEAFNNPNASMVKLSGEIQGWANDQLGMNSSL